jgi:predicted ATPase
LRAGTADREAGLAEMHEGILLVRLQQFENHMPLFMMVLAETEAEAGGTDAGLAIVDSQLAIDEQKGHRTLLAEIHRVRGEILLKCQPCNAAAAESAFAHAIEIARSQSTKLFELQAAASLARLWRDQGKRAEARNLLGPVYGWFTEGFDVPDLKAARALLDELA